MKAYCTYMPRETAVTHLESIKEWDVLAYFNPDRESQARLYAKTGEFHKAVNILDSLLDEWNEEFDDCTYDQISNSVELLHSYLLKVGP